MRGFLLAALLSLAACNGATGVAGTGLQVAYGGPRLISGQSPAAAQSSMSEPQPENSFPPGAEGLQSSGPNNTAPNFLAATISRAH